MKELSIEEKAKRYDEALGKTRQLCDYPTTKPFISDLQDLFPELKESEDERMRNAAINACKYMVDNFENSTKQYEDAIAWLEKQYETFTKKDVDDAYLKGVCDAKHELEKQGKNNMGISEATKKKLEDNLNKALEKETPKSFNEFLDEQGEKKPIFRVGDTIGKVSTGDVVTISEVDIKNKEYRLTNTGFIPFEYESLWQLVEQKPAWSEEDEDILNTIINHFKVDIECTDEDDMVRWLKSLKDRMKGESLC